jgi:mannose-6-phosphate isomerase-like protein (cupin superfamily)
MSAKFSISNAPHYKWGDICDGWWLKKEGPFTVISERMPPDTAEKKHLHNKTEQFFYCLEGSLTIVCETEKTTLHPHEGLTIKPGCPHQVFNTSTTDVHFLVISCPNAHGDRVELE